MADYRVSPDGMTPMIDSETHPSSVSSEATNVTEEIVSLEEKWGFPLDELYKLCLKFYKEKEGKAIHLSYKDKLVLVAYVKQVTQGKYNPTNSPPVGYLDVVGNDRRLTGRGLTSPPPIVGVSLGIYAYYKKQQRERKVWQELGELPRDDAMLAFCNHLNKKCVQLEPYIEAHRREKEEQERIRREEEERRRREEEEREQQRLAEEARRREEEDKQRQEQEKLQFKEAIYQQLLPQLQPLATQRYPDNPQQQQVFLQQLQEHYYHQYLQQLQQQQIHSIQMQQPPQSHPVPSQGGTGEAGDQVGLVENFGNLHLGNEVPPPNGDVTSFENPNAEVPGDLPEIAKASCWTRPNIKEFKGQLAKETESTIRIGHGETVTVRVPTHEEGKYIFWEFATDYYDVGFGLYFEWTVAPSTAISVHVSDSSEDEDDYDVDNDGENGKSDVERGGKEPGPPIDEIIPIYRRDSHEQVLAGSHKYPGQGVYLLKFDNSYSLFRSKTLYYRVYYTRDEPT